MLVSHVEPDQPLKQEQLKLFGPSTHVAPFAHGVSAQSSISVWQRTPEYPSAQEQVKLSMPSEQAPLLRQGLLAHSSTSTSQFVPVYPASQVHA